IHRLFLLCARLRRSLHLRRLLQLRRCRIRMAALRRGFRLVTVHEWPMGLGSRLWLHLGQFSALGLGSLSLWGMALRCLLRRLVLFPADALWVWIQKRS